ncbi:type II toxin-antitoxin system VapC family toxin [Rhizobium sp. 18065]|uniref:type II toxin-antitoxin system VapC family toxin n=1 Tax=Rhizobium sp. 18065 TaxID=2681411 RepID=UPI00135B1DBB|nr:type II toxin-antitoxin system VapC family toxin [Rhizobium sp. 18065]
MRAVRRVYLDTNVFILLAEKTHETQERLVALLAGQPSDAEPRFATSELTLSELLVKPYREQDESLVRKYDSLMQQSEWLDLRPVDRDVLCHAAALRGQYGHLKLPDAIHLSSAIGQGCSHFLSDDRGIRDSYEVRHNRQDPLLGIATLSVLRPDEPTLTSLIESLSA